MGEIKDLSFHEAQHRAETGRSLAKWLVVLLGTGLGVHYGCALSAELMADFHLLPITSHVSVYSMPSTPLEASVHG